MDRRVVLLNDVPGRLPPLVAVGPGVVEEVLVDRGFSEEVLQIREDPQVEELLLDQPMHRLHVRIRVRPARRSEDLLRATHFRHRVDESEVSLLPLAPAEFAPAVCLHRHLARLDPVPLQVPQAPPDQERSIGHAQLLPKAQVQRPALRVPDRILEPG